MSHPSIDTVPVVLLNVWPPFPCAKLAFLKFSGVSTDALPVSRTAFELGSKLRRVETPAVAVLLLSKSSVDEPVAVLLVFNIRSDAPKAELLVLLSDAFTARPFAEESMLRVDVPVPVLCVGVLKADVPVAFVLVRIFRVDVPEA